MGILYVMWTSNTATLKNQQCFSYPYKPGFFDAEM